MKYTMIRVSDEDYKLVNIIADKEDRPKSRVVSQAIKFFARAKRILKD